MDILPYTVVNEFISQNNDLVLIIVLILIYKLYKNDIQTNKHKKRQDDRLLKLEIELKNTNSGLDEIKQDLKDIKNILIEKR